MTVQDIPSGAEALVQLCCVKYLSAGASASAVNGPNSYVAGSAAGLYSVFATVPFIATDYGQGVSELVLPDDATDMNTTGVTALPWASLVSSGPSFSFDPIGGSPSTLIARFAGTASFTVSLLLTGGTEGESCVIWVRKNTVDLIPGRAIVTFDAAGEATADFSAADANTMQGDEYEIVGTAVGTPSSSAFVDTDNSFWLAERLTQPVVSARVAVYDSTDTFLYDVDTDVREGYRGALKFASTAMLPDTGRVKVLVTHDFGESDLEVSADTHLDIVYHAPPVVVQDCPDEGG